MLRNIIAGTLLLLLALNHAQAQTVILEQNNLLDTMDSSFGPNRRHFAQTIYGFGFLFGPEETGARLNNSGSYYFMIGFRYKRKLSPVFSLGSELNSTSYKYSLDPKPGKLLGTLERHEDEIFNNWLLNVEAYFRTNFDPNRGDFLGFFFDLGAGGGYMLSSGYVYRDEQPDGQIREVKYSKLDIFNDWRAHAFARLGYANYSFVFTYRLSNLFERGEQQRFESTSMNALPELPRIGLGLEVAFP